ncbi:MAG: cellulase family glycosylhydrolase, partial [Armatimonadota bacterium]
HGLFVIFDLHDNGQLKLDQPGQDNSGFRQFWTEVATHFRGKRTHDLAFELVNEPVFRDNAEVWFQLQESTVSAIRKIDPERTIVVSGTSWSGIDTMLKLKPLAAKNLIYTCHSYDPFQFTHQGATWTGDQQARLHDIPFPSSPEAVAPVIPKNDSRDASTIKWYGDQKFDANYLDGMVKKAVDWGKANNVPVFLGEFGVYPPTSPKDSRAYWFESMKTALVKHRLSYCIWGYDDGFGLGRRIDSQGRVQLDNLTIEHFYKHASNGK